jgi:hypothetical protein
VFSFDSVSNKGVADPERELGVSDLGKLFFFNPLDLDAGKSVGNGVEDIVEDAAEDLTAVLSMFGSDGNLLRVAYLSEDLAP